MRYTPPADVRRPDAERLWSHVGERKENAMVTQVVTWAGAVLGLLVLVLMALSGVFVDSQR
ncbi:hypothetical protein GCM10022243_27110 [Saccharothrix violaceirubra]